MSRFDLNTSAAHIRDALEELQQAWQQSSADWNDSVSRRFCQQHLDPIGPSVKMALDALGQATQQISQMQRECDEPRRAGR